VGVHYAKMVILIITAGLVTGIAAGIWLGKMMGNIYMEFYRFPAFIYTLHPEVIITAVSVSVISALAGTMHSLWKAAKQPPAEAMRPEAPAKYR